jgi:hypothetical protein
MAVGLCVQFNLFRWRVGASLVSEIRLPAAEGHNSQLVEDININASPLRFHAFVGGPTPVATNSVLGSRTGPTDEWTDPGTSYSHAQVCTR